MDQSISITVAGREDVSIAGQPRAVYRVSVQSALIPEQETLTGAADRVALAEGEVRRFNDRTVFLYLPGQPIDGLAYAVAEYVGTRRTAFRLQPVSLIGTEWQTT